MSKEKFTLLDKKYPEGDKSNTDNSRILELKKKARDLREKNNNLIKQLWDVDFDLNKPGLSTEQRAHLTRLKDRINQEIVNKNYPPKIKLLLEDIQKLELSLYGQSKVNSNSPYTL